MDDHGTTRRSALRQLIAAIGAVSLDWAAIAKAGHDAHVAAQSPASLAYTLLATGDAA
jgi:hypothetical protein